MELIEIIGTLNSREKIQKPSAFQVQFKFTTLSFLPRIHYYWLSQQKKLQTDNYNKKSWCRLKYPKSLNKSFHRYRSRSLPDNTNSTLKNFWILFEGPSKTRPTVLTHDHHVFRPCRKNTISKSHYIDSLFYIFLILNQNLICDL